MGELQELIIVDEENGLACFIPILNNNSKINSDVNKDIDISLSKFQTSSDLPYAFKFQTFENNASLSLLVCGDHTKFTKSVGCTEEWLKDELFARILKWSQSV